MRRYYCRWQEDDIKGLHLFSGLASLYTESNEQGVVLREVGLNTSGKTIHRYPSDKYKFGTRGLFDNQTVVLSSMTEKITKDEFETIWNLP